jgi:hypothetical protein
MNYMGTNRSAFANIYSISSNMLDPVDNARSVVLSLPSEKVHLLEKE